MYAKKCAACGGDVERSVGPVPFEVRGETLSVNGIEHGKCTRCGEVYLSLDAAEQLQRRAIRQSKAAKKLLSPEEIRAFRQSLGLSQSAFESLLGVGPKTVVRWEKGTVFQNSATDLLIRLLRAKPELVDLVQSGDLYRDSYSCALGTAHGLARETEGNAAEKPPR